MQKVVDKDVPENQGKEEESKKVENEGDYQNGDELDEAVDFLMELEYRGQLSFEDIDC